MSLLTSNFIEAKFNPEASYEKYIFAPNKTLEQLNKFLLNFLFIYLKAES